MTSEEFTAWAKEQATHAGHWKTDLIHNGQNGRDLMVYVAEPGNPTGGIFVNITATRLTSGRFHSAIPHMGDAIYVSKHVIAVKSISEGVQIAVERLGLSFLLALTHGTSPTRVLTGPQCICPENGPHDECCPVCIPALR